MNPIDEIKLRFTHHPPKKGQAEKYTEIREKALALALDIERLCPSSRESALAITHLEETVFFANAAIARRSE
jgi:hypothetical protein